ncbi:MAG: integrase arm-type DNA-binding domain-containing protein [Chitinophagaceae bacterium]
MPLTDMQCKTAKPRIKPYKLSDGGGLYLEIAVSGGKYWRQKYRIFGKEKRLTHGAYPELSLLDARLKALAAKKELKNGIDPAIIRLEATQLAKANQPKTFEQLANEWVSRQNHVWTARYTQSIKFRLEKYALREIGSYPVRRITSPIMLACLQQIEKKSPETTRRIKALCSNIFKYGIATGQNDIDPTFGLEAALKKYRKGHYASLSVDEFPTLLMKMHEYRDRISRQTFLALNLLLLTFVRTGELIEARRNEFNLESKMWIIPAERMKMRLPHMVPLSNQSIKIIREMLTFYPNSEFLFPSYSNWKKPMSKNTMLIAIKRMGFNGRMTGHGFRSLALGLLKEKLSYSHEIADRQLAHVPKNSVDRAYDRAQFLPQRVEMMQKYADYIDEVYIQSVVKKLNEKI